MVEKPSSLTQSQSTATRWTAIILLMVSGLLLVGIGLLVPAHFRAIDATVLREASARTPNLIDEGIRLLSENRVGQGRLFLTAAQQCDLQETEGLERVLTKITAWQETNRHVSEIDLILKDDPWAMRWDGKPVMKLLTRRDSRQKVQQHLGSAYRSGVLEFLKTLQFTNLVYFSPAYTASGQPYEVAALTAALLVHQDHLPESLRDSMDAMAYSATRKGETMNLERYYLDLVTLGNRLNWGQMMDLMKHVKDIETLTDLANLARQKGNQWQLLFAAAYFQESADDVAGYLLRHARTGRKDLALALGMGQGGLAKLIETGRRIKISPTRERLLEYDPFYTILATWIRLTHYSQTMALILKYGLILLGTFFLGRAVIDVIPAQDWQSVKRWCSPVHLALTGALVILVIALCEPFLFQESKTLAFPLHWKFPNMSGSIAETLTSEFKTMIDKLTILALVIFLVLQAVIYVVCLLKLAEIRRQSVPNKVKLELLDNEENMFDAGLYAGLGGTVLSLVLLAMGVIKPSLMAAYASTLFGIIFVALLKICHLRPLRRKLIMELDNAAGN